MIGTTQALDKFVLPVTGGQVYRAAPADLDLSLLPLTIGGRLVTAVAQHPEFDDVLYLTTEHPDALLEVSEMIWEL